MSKINPGVLDNKFVPICIPCVYMYVCKFMFPPIQKDSQHFYPFTKKDESLHFATGDTDTQDAAMISDQAAPVAGESQSLCSRLGAGLCASAEGLSSAEHGYSWQAEPSFQAQAEQLYGCLNCSGVLWSGRLDSHSVVIVSKPRCLSDEKALNCLVWLESSHVGYIAARKASYGYALPYNMWGPVKCGFRNLRFLRQN